MISTPKISIVIPIYNAELYLSQCIDSVLSQTFKDFELILVDDGSTDRSEEICIKYTKKDCRIRVFHEENSGVTSARKLGVENSNGLYICFVDADDRLPSNSLQDLFSVADNVDMVIGGYQEIYPNKKITHTFTKIPTEFKGLDYIRFQLENKIYHGPCAKLIKKTCFSKDTLDIPRSIFRGEDFLMNIRLGKNIKKIKLINTIVYHYMIRETSCMMTRKPTLAYEKLFDKYLIASLDEKQLQTCLQTSILHQRIEAVTGLFLAKSNIDFDDEFIQSVYKASKISSLSVSQILIRTSLNHPAIYRLIYRIARKLKIE